jgi:alanine racemase
LLFLRRKQKTPPALATTGEIAIDDAPTLDPPQAAPAEAPEAAAVLDRAAIDTLAGRQHVLDAAPIPLDAGCVLAVDLGAIVANWKALAKRVLPAQCAAVVKADAYGCGIDEVTAELAKAGCETFFVADLAEARRVRGAAPQAAIYVLNGLAPDSAELFAKVNGRPVIGSLSEFLEWDAFRTATGWRGGAALHFDTGMNRLGLDAEEANAFTARVKAPEHGIALFMSHLACADRPDHPLNGKQVAAFRELRFAFRGIASSLANSSGIFLGPATHCDMVRPGGALYGVNPTPTTQNLMEQAVGLKARIVQVRDVPRGASVGYGATWTASRRARIAIVAAGYAQGYLRIAGTAQSGTQAIIAHRRCPIVGRVSMDLMAFDVTGLSADLVRRGTVATLIGNGIATDDVARWCGTIGYEVLTGLGSRCRRVWMRPAEPAATAG